MITLKALKVSSLSLLTILLLNPTINNAFATDGKVVTTVNTDTFFRVGLSLREEALAELIAERVVQKLATRSEQQQAGSAVQAIVNKSCLKCHGPDNEGGVTDLTNVKALSNEAFLKVFNQVATKKMPKNAPPLSDVQINEFLKELIERGNE